jgi:hypothetical protein
MNLAYAFVLPVDEMAKSNSAAMWLKMLRKRWPRIAVAVMISTFGATNAII